DARPHPTSTPFPYTTLFRSEPASERHPRARFPPQQDECAESHARIGERAEDPPLQERRPEHLREAREQVDLGRSVGPEEVAVGNLAVRYPPRGLEHQALVERIDLAEDRERR